MSDPTREGDAASGHGSTVFQWLVERGQPERQEPTVWLENSALHPASHQHWTTDANEAAMFPNREAAEKYIYEGLTHPIRGASARAVEHGFMVALTREEKLEAVARAAERYLAASNTLAFRPSKEVETAAAQAHHDLTEALNALD